MCQRTRALDAASGLSVKRQILAPKLDSHQGARSSSPSPYFGSGALGFDASLEGLTCRHSVHHKTVKTFGKCIYSTVRARQVPASLSQRDSRHGTGPGCGRAEVEAVLEDQIAQGGLIDPLGIEDRLNSVFIEPPLGRRREGPRFVVEVESPER